MRIKIKPLSVNKCWQGRRFKTPTYKSYETELLLKLPKINISSGELSVTITFGFSNKLADVDNSVKPFIDILQKKYMFNDRQIYLLILKKEIVSKGDEFIDFIIEEMKTNETIRNNK